MFGQLKKKEFKKIENLFSKFDAAKTKFCFLFSKTCFWEQKEKKKISCIFEIKNMFGQLKKREFSEEKKQKICLVNLMLLKQNYILFTKGKWKLLSKYEMQRIL